MGYSLTYFPHFPFSTSFADTSSSNYSAMPEIHDCSTELCTKTVIIPFVVYVCREIKVLVSLSTSAARPHFICLRVINQRQMIYGWKVGE